MQPPDTFQEYGTLPVRRSSGLETQLPLCDAMSAHRMNLRMVIAALT
jgi:hypothetical protein